jgi:DNA-binding IclR family transcriptional regulator
MACVNPDGSLSTVAMLMLDYLSEPRTDRDIADRAAQPMYRIRSSLRELEAAGLVEKDGEHWVNTPKGAEVLKDL